MLHLLLEQHHKLFIHRYLHQEVLQVLLQEEEVEDQMQQQELP